MNIKSSKELVDEANKSIKTMSPDEVKSAYDKGEITLIDVRDIRELWKEGTIKDAVHIPRGMLEFWLDPQSSYYQEKKMNDVKNIVLFCALGFRSALSTKSLKDMGFKNVANASGGFDSLKKNRTTSNKKRKKIVYFLASLIANSILSCPQKILLFETKLGAPKIPFS